MFSISLSLSLWNTRVMSVAHTKLTHTSGYLPLSLRYQQNRTEQSRRTTVLEYGTTVELEDSYIYIIGTTALSRALE